LGIFLYKSALTKNRFGSAKRGINGKSLNIPGPGAYSYANKMGKEGRKFTIIGRPKSMDKTSKAPAPNAYSPIDTNQKGKKQGFRYF
jgi:hypothetical protein